MQLLYLMHYTAMQELGKINPFGGEISCDLEKAKQAIEMLEMLSHKQKVIFLKNWIKHRR